MERTVKLGGKDLRLLSSLGTILVYKRTFGTELFDDVEAFNVKEGDTKASGKLIDILFRLVYVLHRPFEDISYEDFLLQFDFDVLTNEKELTELSNVIGELLGGLKTNKQAGNISPQR